MLELIHPETIPGEREIPPEGAIDEAVETAKRFCGAEAPGFVNGILAAALRERPR
jgi:N utilization substance protein B